MSVMVGMKNDAGDIKFVKVGWSWTCFFFGSFFGIPWFMRKLPGFGAIGVVMALGSLVAVFALAFWGAIVGVEFGGSLYLLINNLFRLAAMGFNVFGAFKANELTIRNYLKTGYKFMYPESPEIAFMNSKYHIF